MHGASMMFTDWLCWWKFIYLIIKSKTTERNT